MGAAASARRLATLVIACAALACAGAHPEALVICHNGNCAGPPDTERDDTVEELTRSLALRGDDGRPILDGVELDLFWHGAADRCLFAHDTNGSVDIPPDAAIAEVARYLRETADPSRNGDRFRVFLELKPTVGPKRDDLHTPAQLAAHADCALDMLATLEQAASDSGHRLEVVFDSAEPKLLEALVDRPRWPGPRLDDVYAPVTVRLSADFGAKLRLARRIRSATSRTSSWTWPRNTWIGSPRHIARRCSP